MLVKKQNIKKEIIKFRNKHIDFLNQRKVGVIVPLYVYPSNVFTNPIYNYVIDAIRTFPDVPVIIILNPSNGPGDVRDGNFTKAIDRLKGAGAKIAGYIFTSYRTRKLKNVISDIKQWLNLYPAIDGIFVDEVLNVNESFIAEEGESFAFYDAKIYNYYKTITDIIHDLGLEYSILNPGTGLPKEWFDVEAGDIYIIFENNYLPSLDYLRGDYDGGYIDYLFFRRGALLYGFTETNFRDNLGFIVQMLNYLGWVYFTNDNLPNPWDTISGYFVLLLDLINKINREKNYISNIRFVSTNAQLSIEDNIVIATQSGITLTLPSANIAIGKNLIIKNISSLNITIQASGTDTIEGLNSRTLASFQVLEIVSDGVDNWLILRFL